MREIKFRGKRVDNGEWVYGFYRQYPIYKPCGTCIDHINHFIDFDCFSEFVDPETVGQYTGLKDKDDKEIYESDILRWTDHEPIGNDYRIVVGYVIYDNGSYCIQDIEDSTEYGQYCIYGSECEIIGNIHDNPELIKPQD